MHFFSLLKVIRAVSSSFLKKVIIWNAYTQKEIHQKNTCAIHWPLKHTKK